MWPRMMMMHDGDYKKKYSVKKTIVRDINLIVHRIILTSGLQ